MRPTNTPARTFPKTTGYRVYSVRHSPGCWTGRGRCSRLGAEPVTPEGFQTPQTKRSQLADRQRGWLPPRLPLTAANVLPPPSLRSGMTRVRCVLRGRQTFALSSKTLFRYELSKRDTLSWVTPAAGEGDEGNAGETGVKSGPEVIAMHGVGLIIFLNIPE